MKTDEEKKKSVIEKKDEDFTEFLEWDEDTEDEFLHLIDTDFDNNNE